MNLLRSLNWTNTLFLTLTPILAIIGTIWIVQTGQLQAPTIIFAIAYTLVTGLTITAGYHRLFSHRAYKTIWPIRLFMALVGAATFEGSVLEWCTDHRRHHLYVDTDRDPYNINRGFWYAHIGWLFFLDPATRDFSNVKDLSADPILRFQHRFFYVYAIIMGFILPTAIASLWGDPWGGFLIAGVLRVVVNHQLTFCINSVCHIFGKQTYSLEQSGRDNWVTALFTYGEGFHNFHHQFMFDYRNGIRFYHFDPAKWLIRTLAYFGLARDLKRVSVKQILRYRMKAEEARLSEKHKKPRSELLQHFEHLLHPLHERILHTATFLEQLETDYLALKEKKLREYHSQLKNLRQQLKKARLDLNTAFRTWKTTLRRHAGSAATL